MVIKILMMYVSKSNIKHKRKKCYQINLPNFSISLILYIRHVALLDILQNTLGNFNNL